MIIFGLLMKAKALAVEYSGEMGQNMSKIGAAIGGLALGGAALGAAAIGRSTIGAFAKGASTGDTYARRLAAERTSGIRDTNLTAFQRLQGRLSQGTGLDRLQQRYGERLNRQGAEIRGATHARHDLDTAANVVAPGKKWDDLNGIERRAAKQNIERTRLMRERGFGNRTWAQLTDMERLGINTDVEDRLNTGTTYTDTHTIPQARRKVGLRENLEQSTIGGSFDVRNLSKLVAGEQDNSRNKFATGLASILGNSIRSSIKSSLGAQYGTGQKDFFKDLGHTLSEALKGAKISVDLSSVGKVEKESHGGGGGGGHH